MIIVNVDADNNIEIIPDILKGVKESDKDILRYVLWNCLWKICHIS